MKDYVDILKYYLGDIWVFLNKLNRFIEECVNY